MTRHVSIQPSVSNPIVVIDDCAEDFAIIRDGLERHANNPAVMHFSDSRSARQWLEETETPARLVLLDLNLPGEMGNSLLETFKNHPRHKTTPVIILSSSDDPRDVVGCYRSGANSYHTKPLEIEKFYQIMEDIAGYWLNSVYLIRA